MKLPLLDKKRQANVLADPLSSSRILTLPDLAPYRFTGWLPRLHRAGPSASLDKSVNGIFNCSGSMIPYEISNVKYPTAKAKENDP
jgi:hypothetical protein